VITLKSIEEILEFADMEKETVRKIWEEVKANHKKLDN